MTAFYFLHSFAQYKTKGSRYTTGMNPLYFNWYFVSFAGSFPPISTVRDWWLDDFHMTEMHVFLQYLHFALLVCIYFLLNTFHALLLANLVFANGKMNKDLNISVVSELFLKKYLLFNLLVKPQGGNRVSSKVIDYLCDRGAPGRNTTCQFLRVVFFLFFFCGCFETQIFKLCLQTELTRDRRKKVNIRY